MYYGNPLFGRFMLRLRLSLCVPRFFHPLTLVLPAALHCILPLLHLQHLPYPLTYSRFALSTDSSSLAAGEELHATCYPTSGYSGPLTGYLCYVGTLALATKFRTNDPAVAISALAVYHPAYYLPAAFCSLRLRKMPLGKADRSGPPSHCLTEPLHPNGACRISKPFYGNTTV